MKICRWASSLLRIICPWAIHLSPVMIRGYDPVLAHILSMTSCDSLADTEASSVVLEHMDIGKIGVPRSVKITWWPSILSIWNTIPCSFKKLLMLFTGIYLLNFHALHQLSGKKRIVGSQHVDLHVEDRPHVLFLVDSP